MSWTSRTDVESQVASLHVKRELGKVHVAANHDLVAAFVVKKTGAIVPKGFFNTQILDTIYFPLFCLSLSHFSLSLSLSNPYNHLHSLFWYYKCNPKSRNGGSTFFPLSAVTFFV